VPAEFSHREESPEGTEGGALRCGSPQRSRTSATREDDVWNTGSRLGQKGLDRAPRTKAKRTLERPSSDGTLCPAPVAAREASDEAGGRGPLAESPAGGIAASLA